MLDCLKKNGMEENTLVGIYQRNGPVSAQNIRAAARESCAAENPQPGKGGAGPLLVRWPRQVPAGRTRPGITYLMDLLPTSVALSGARLPDERPLTAVT